MSDQNTIFNACKNWQNEDNDRRAVAIIMIEPDKGDQKNNSIHCGLIGYRGNFKKAFYTILEKEVTPLKGIITEAFEANAVRQLESALEKIQEAEKRVKEAKDE